MKQDEKNFPSELNWMMYVRKHSERTFFLFVKQPVRVRGMIGEKMLVSKGSIKIGQMWVIESEIEDKDFIWYLQLERE